ncbi:3008_t:CDS:2, partial [Scutellospora calospora]
PYAGFICSCPLPGFGKQNYISPTQIYKLLKSDIEQPQPEYSDHTISQKTWTMPVCRLSETLDNLRNDNIRNVENVITKSTDLMDIDKSPDITLFLLPLGWALKYNQKYGKKGGKRLSKDVVEALKRFFILGQANSSDRYTASDMHNSLLELVESGVINEEDVPTQNTIENWINRYS